MRHIECRRYDSVHCHSYDVATGNLEINPNAMLVTDRHVCAASLGKGLLVHDRSTGRWTSIRAGLPSEIVTALAADKACLHIGTDNGLGRGEKHAQNDKNVCNSFRWKKDFSNKLQTAVLQLNR